jgi:hypothetical protein
MALKLVDGYNREDLSLIVGGTGLPELPADHPALAPAPTARAAADKDYDPEFARALDWLKHCQNR